MSTGTVSLDGWVHTPGRPSCKALVPPPGRFDLEYLHDAQVYRVGVTMRTAAIGILHVCMHVRACVCSVLMSVHMLVYVYCMLCILCSYVHCIQVAS